MTREEKKTRTRHSEKKNYTEKERMNGDRRNGRKNTVKKCKKKAE